MDFSWVCLMVMENLVESVHLIVNLMYSVVNLCYNQIEEHLVEETKLEKSQDVSSYILSCLKDCNKCMHDKKYAGGFDDVCCIFIN